MGEGLGALCVSYIYKRSSHWRGSILINPSLHKGTTYGWESGFHHMKFLGDAKAETIADTNVNWLFLLRWLSSPTLHWSSFPASPCSHSIHSITLGFTSPVSQMSAPSHIQPIQCFPLPCWGPGNLPGNTDVSIFQGSFSLPLWIFIPWAIFKQCRW